MLFDVSPVDCCVVASRPLIVSIGSRGDCLVTIGGCIVFASPFNIFLWCWVLGGPCFLFVIYSGQ